MTGPDVLGRIGRVAAPPGLHTPRPDRTEGLFVKAAEIRKDRRIPAENSLTFYLIKALKSLEISQFNHIYDWWAPHCENSFEGTANDCKRPTGAGRHGVQVRGASKGGRTNERPSPNDHSQEPRQAGAQARHPGTRAHRPRPGRVRPRIPGPRPRRAQPRRPDTATAAHPSARALEPNRARPSRSRSILESRCFRP